MRKLTFEKIKRRLWGELVRHTRHSSFYPYIYRSYWHTLLHASDKRENTTSYYAARPNPGAGIGHQMANWIAGLWYARQFGLKFAHLPFSTSQWETLLGFGIGEKTVKELKQAGYMTRKLPMFQETNEKEVELNRRIIQSYAGRKVVFIAEQDQFYRNQYGVIDELKRKFYTAPSRKDDHLLYSPKEFNIAIHVRRTVVIGNQIIHENETIRAMRWLSNDYYEKVLRQVLETIHVDKPIHVYLFTTGKAEEFAEFTKYGTVRICSDLDEYSSFAHLVFADLLITSKSSFSYKAGLINNGIKVSPKNFWHGYPDTKDWILCENDGTFDSNKLKLALQ